MQANREGGLPDASRLLAQAIARDAPLRVRVCDNVEKRRAGIPLERTVTTRIAPDNDSRLPMPGSLIARQFRGQTIVVKVTDAAGAAVDLEKGQFKAFRFDGERSQKQFVFHLTGAAGNDGGK